MSADQPLTGDELATIKARAEAAWGCEWVISDEPNDSYRVEVKDSPQDTPLDQIADAWDDDNAEHIAGMDPATTLRLVAEIERLQAFYSRLGELPGQWYASTADGLGHRRDHWRGPDYAEGVDAGVEGCADVLRETLEGTS